jgi:hypothetical protein
MKTVTEAHLNYMCHNNLYNTIYAIVAISALRIHLCVSNHRLHVQDKEQFNTVVC